MKYIEISEGEDYNLPAQGIDIYVTDAEDQTLVSHYSDVDGSFVFANVALGTYWLYPEVAGITQERRRVEVTIDEPDVSDIEIILIPGNIDGIDPERSFISDNTLSLPYPNPTTDLVYLNIEATAFYSAVIDVYDLQGRKLASHQLNLQSGPNTLSMKIAKLKGGVYFVRANVNGTISEQRFIVNK